MELGVSWSGLFCGVRSSPPSESLSPMSCRGEAGDGGRGRKNGTRLGTLQELVFGSIRTNVGD